MLTVQILLWISACSLALGLAENFNPRSYTKQKTSCPAIHRNGGQGEPREVSIDMSYVDLNPTANRTIVFVHGWSGLWAGWSNQILHFQDKYRLIVPDVRGFGDSTHPGDVQASGTHADIVGDLVCILKHAGISKAVCVGHDWGAQLCYEATRERPDIFEAVVGAAIPYIPAAGDRPLPIDQLKKTFPKLTYNMYFEKDTAGAVAELNQDIRRTLRATLRDVASPPPDKFLRSPTSFLKAYKHMETIPPIPFFTPEQEDYYVEEYQKQGYANTLQFYTKENKFRNWDFAHRQGNWTIPKPALSILPLRDPVADWPLAGLMLQSRKYLPYLTIRVLETAHWIHMEKPKEFNAILEDWLNDLDNKLLKAEQGEAEKDASRLKGEL